MGLLMKKKTYYIVEASALPDVFIRVTEAKRLLDSGEVSTVNEATRRTGISRSAFYKYRDVIKPMSSMMAGRILTFQMTLRDISGLLSTILSIFAQKGANILTINQTIPIDGSAGVTISAETTAMVCTVEELLQELQGTKGVVRAGLLAG